MTGPADSADPAEEVVAAREAEALKHYLDLGKPVPGGGVQNVSSFWAALRDARGATGRDLDTGAVVNPEHSASWLGAIGYLCLIDQIGSAVRRPSRDPQPPGGAYPKAFHNFAPGVSSRERNALYALRNALAHDYSLMNQSERPALQHSFRLWPDANQLVSIPDPPWDGSLVGLRPTTDVGLRCLGDLVEGIAEDVLDAYGSEDLDTALSADDTKVSGIELIVRWGFTVHL